MNYTVPTIYKTITGIGVVPTIPTVENEYDEGVLATDLFFGKYAYNIDDKKFYFHGSEGIESFYNHDFKKGVEYFPPYDEVFSYEEDEFVSYNNLIYRAKGNVPPGVTPENETFWENKGEWVESNPSHTDVLAELQNLKTSVDRFNSIGIIDESNIGQYLEVINSKFYNELHGDSGVLSTFQTQIIQSQQGIIQQVNQKIWGEPNPENGDERTLWREYTSLIDQVSGEIVLAVDQKIYDQYGKITEEYTSAIDITSKDIELSVNHKIWGTDGAGAQSVYEQFLADIAITENSINLSVDSKIAGISAGNRNLIINSGKFLNSNHWVSNGSTISIDSTVKYGIYNTLKLDGINGAYNDNIMRLNPETEYTVSAYVKSNMNLTGSSDSQLNIQVWTVEDEVDLHQENSVSFDQDLTANTWKLVKQTFSTPASSDLCFCKFYFYPLDTGCILNVGYVKLEQGNVSSDWTPAIEDIESSITEAKSLITQLSDSISMSVFGTTTIPVGSSSNYLEQRITDAYQSEIAVERGRISLVVDDNGVRGSVLIQTINNESSVKIAANKIQIDGSTTFGSGYNPNEALNVANTAISDAAIADGKAVTAQNTIDNLKVGAKNLIPNSGAKNDNGWSVSGVINTLGFDWFYRDNSTSNENYIVSPLISILPNTQYTISFYYFNTSNIISIGLYGLPSNFPSTGIPLYHNLQNSTSPKYVSYTFTSGDLHSDILIRIDNNGSNNGSNARLYVSRLKFELGNRSTDWTPAPEDVASDITTAQNAANNALSQLTNITSDNILSKNEKPGIKSDYDTIIAEQSGIEAQIASCTEKTNYHNAVSALTTYLTGLNPSYSDFTQDTTIVGTTLYSKFQDVYTTKQIVLNKIYTIITGLANDANTLAASKTKTFRQGTTPTGANENDIWINTDAGNETRTYHNSTWVLDLASSIANAIKPFADNTTQVTGGLVMANAIMLGSSGVVKAGICGLGSADTDIRFWAGETYANKTTAPFRALQNGKVYASDISITGGSVNIGNTERMFIADSSSVKLQYKYSGPWRDMVELTYETATQGFAYGVVKVIDSYDNGTVGATTLYKSNCIQSTLGFSIKSPDSTTLLTVANDSIKITCDYSTDIITVTNALTTISNPLKFRAEVKNNNTDVSNPQEGQVEGWYYQTSYKLKIYLNGAWRSATLT